MTRTRRATDDEVVEKLHRFLRRWLRLHELGADAVVIAQETEIVGRGVRELVDRGALPASWPDDLRAAAAELIPATAHTESALFRAGIDGARTAAAKAADLGAALAAVPIRNLHITSSGTTAVIDGSVASVALRDRVTALAMAAGWTITNRLHVPRADSLLFRTATLALVGTHDGTVALRRHADGAEIFALPAESLRVAVIEDTTLVVRGTFPAGVLRIAEPGLDPVELLSVARELQARFWLVGDEHPGAAPSRHSPDAARVRSILAAPARANELDQLSPIDGDSVAALLEGVGGTDIRLACRCVAALQRTSSAVSPRDVATGLLAVIAHPESTVRSAVVMALATGFAFLPRVVDVLLGRLLVEPSMNVVQELVTGLGRIRGLHAPRVSGALVALLSHAVHVDTGDKVLPRYRAAGGAAAEPPSAEVLAKRWPLARDYDPVEQAIAGVVEHRAVAALPWLSRLCRCRALPIFTHARQAIVAFDGMAAANAELVSALRAIADDARSDGDVATTCWAIAALGAATAARGMQTLWLAARLADGDGKVATAATEAIARILERDRDHVPAEVVERLVAAAMAAPPKSTVQAAIWLALECAGHPPALPLGTLRLADAVVATIPLPGVIASRTCAVRGEVVFGAAATTAPASGARDLGVMIIDLATRTAELVPLPFRLPAPTRIHANELALVADLPSGPVFLLVATSSNLHFLCEWRVAVRAWFLWHESGEPVPLTADSFAREHATLVGLAGLRIWVEPGGKLTAILDGHVGDPYGDDPDDFVPRPIPSEILAAQARAQSYERERELAAIVERVDVSRPGMWSLPWATYFNPGAGITPRTALAWTSSGVRHRVIITEDTDGRTTALVLR